MGVEVEGDGDAGVPKSLRRHLGMDARLEHRRRGGVA